MKKNLIIILSVFLLLLVSCEKEANNVMLPEFEQKLVLSGYIHPSDNEQRIFVSSNRRLFGMLDKNEYYGKLTATITDGTRTVELMEQKIEIMFPHTPEPKQISSFAINSSDLQIIPGETYTLRVQSDIGLSAEATCTVPQERNFYLEVDTATSYHNQGDWWFYKQLVAEYHITDFPGEVNYYMLYVTQVNYSHGNSNPEVIQFYNETETYDDKLFDGKRFLIGTNYLIPTNNYDSSFLKVYLMNVDEAYYKLTRSLGKYSSGDDPFTEASPIYSNVTGGLGIFASYTRDSVILRLK